MLAPGTKLGPYEIVAPLGSGGMGEVYRARDSRLGREVAVKVLPQHLSSSPEVRARFEREARTVSSLNHPNICTVYDVGREGETDYLVMERVEGETLAERLRRGPLAPAETLRLGAQIADALDRAHRAGVIHRDLKPGNVMLARTGVKLMDFGLARATGMAGPAGGSGASIAGLTQSPTIAQPLTAEGTIVGTFQYMSPEQLEGKEADARSDLWALGCTLYEMATGRRAFDGRSQASLISAIMTSEPPAIAGPAGDAGAQGATPAALDRAVRQCLAKDPDDRWQNAGDLKRELEWILAQGSRASALRPVARRPHARLQSVLTAWAVLATGAAALLAAWSRGGSDHGGAAILTMRTPPDLSLSIEPADIAVSPDGRRVAFCTVDSTGISRLWVRALDEPGPRPIPESEAAQRPFWSPDSRWVAFFTTVGRPDGERPRLKKAPVDGGPPVSLCEIEWTRGGAWNERGDILFVPTPQSGIDRISASGGAVTHATQLDSSRQENSQRYPSFLPDGVHFVYTSLPHGPDGFPVCVASLRSKAVKIIGASASGATYVDPGYLVFERDRKIVAQRFDTSRLALMGDAIPIAAAPPITAEDGTRIATGSRNGRLTLLDRAHPTTHLEWFDRAGRSLGRAPVASGDYIACSLSPNERLAAVRMTASRFTSQVLVVDLARGTASQLTDSHSENEVGPWSPDGRSIAIMSTRSGREEIFVLASDATGEARHLATFGGQFKAPQAWSPDGRTLVFYEMRPKTGFDLFTVDMAGGGPPRPVATNPGAEVAADISPDGRWMAYNSDETGTNEVFVCALADGRDKIQVTTRGGLYPKWTRDGGEIVFLGLDLKTWYASAFKAGSPPLAGEARPLFHLAESEGDAPSWDYAKKSGRFLMLRPDASDRAPDVTVMFDWTRQLKRRAAP